MSEDRLQKILARAGLGSRRAAEEVITEGRVTVNGRVATLGDKADTERDAIKVDGKRLHPPREHHYLLLNKPREVMSTASDPEGRPTVLELVPPGLRKAMVPVGRLDFLTEGLILLTDDGDFAQRVAHPRYGCTKTYEVKVRGTPDARSLDRLRRGIVLEGERTRPAAIEARPVKSDTGNSWWNVELGQGRTRQIREMFQRIGHPVMKLRRVAIGPVRDPDLPLGKVRELTEKEVDLLRRAGKHRAKAQAAKARAESEAPKRKGPPARKAKKVKKGQAAGKKAQGAATARAAGKTGGRRTKGAAKARPAARRAPARDGAESEGRPERSSRAAGPSRDRRPQGGGKPGGGAGRKPVGGGAGRRPGAGKAGGAGRSSPGGAGRKAGPGSGKTGGGAGRKPGPGAAGRPGGGGGRKPGGGGGRRPSGGSSGRAGGGGRGGSGGGGRR